MNSTLIRALFAGGLMTGQAALAETKTFTGSGGFRWAVPESWSPQGEPQASDDAVFPSTLTEPCVIDVTDAVARTITIATNKELQIKEGGTLTLHGDGVTSYITGQLKFVDGSSGDAVLWFKNDHTLNTSENGSGSERMVRGDVLGTIKGDSGAVLTVNRDASPLSLKGNLRIEIELVNNANVEAHLGDLTLAENPKRGEGFWKATGGTLTVNVEVTECGPWEVGQDGIIEVNVPLTEITGRVKIVHGGQLLLNASWCTPGKLEWFSGVIQLGTASPPLTASFGGVCAIDP